MSIYLFDSDTFSHFKYRNPALERQMALHESDVFGLTMVTVEEALGGWYKQLRQARTHAEVAKSSRSSALTMQLMSSFQVFPETEKSLEATDQIVKAKLNIGKMDIRIAAIALELVATVVTRNTRDFSRIPNLMIADWTV